MEKIQAADNLFVELGHNSWRLVSGAVSRPLFTARTDQGHVVYPRAFADARSLPADGAFSVDHIAEVVVGWSRADGAWHLGLLLDEQTAAARSGRWCELARWPDAQAQYAAAAAKVSGQGLARVIGRPFRFVSPQATAEPAPRVSSPPPDVLPEAGPAAPAAAVAPELVRVSPRQPAPPIDLPLEFGEWTLREIPLGLQWAHTGLWSLGALSRIVLRLGLGVVFIAVSVLSLQSPYAAVQPVGLPYLGIVIGIGLLLAAVQVVLVMLRTEAVVFDAGARQVRRHLDLTSDVLDVYDFAEVQAVVVTQAVQQRQRGRGEEPDTAIHEAWLHLLMCPSEDDTAEDFVLIGHVLATEGPVVAAHLAKENRKRPPQRLYPDEATTPALKAGVKIAEIIGVTPYIDQR